ncbi:MAG: M3 family metallopeptidase, partial [Planctomycetota bacterium]
MSSATSTNEEQIAKPEGLLPKRSQVPQDDRWDLSALFESDDAWEKSFAELEQDVPTYESFRGRLGESADVLLEMLRFDSEFDRKMERTAIYAFLKTTEDQGNSDYQAMKMRMQNLSVRSSQAASYINPELLAIKAEQMDAFIVDPLLEGYRLQLERLIRQRPHTLSDAEERLLAMQGEMASAAGNAFRQLNDVDLRFGKVEDEHGKPQELSHASFISMLHKPSRKIRHTAFSQYYQEIAEHENTLAATLGGSIQRDVYYAKVRNHGSALEAALFPDNVPTAVYDNLITAVRGSLPAVHHYFDVRQRKMGLSELHHYDTYVPILSDMKKSHSWDEAVSVVLDSLAPLGSEYVDTLANGLKSRWADRYPNRGKQSGAFSCGSFDGAPY